MDYGSLLQQSWRLTWRHRFLWVLGLFVPGFGGSCSGGNSGGSLSDLTEEAGEEGRAPGRNDLVTALEAVGRWLEQNLGLAIGLAVALLLLGLIWLVVSFVAQGGMARATATLARGQGIAAGETWRIGWRLFWRYLGLGLLNLGLNLLALLLIAAAVLLAVALGSATSGALQVVLIILSVLVVGGLILAALACLIGLSVAITFAQRVIAVDDAGPVAAFQAGVRLLRRHLRASALVWLINLGLSIGATIALGLALLILAVPLGIIGFVLYTSLGLSTVPIAYTVVAALVVIAVGWFLSAIANTYSWHYWTLAYLRLTDRLTAHLEPLPLA